MKSNDKNQKRREIQLENLKKAYKNAVERGDLTKSQAKTLLKSLMEDYKKQMEENR